MLLCQLWNCYKLALLIITGNREGDFVKNIDAGFMYYIFQYQPKYIDKIRGMFWLPPPPLHTNFLHKTLPSHAQCTLQVWEENRECGKGKHYFPVWSGSCGQSSSTREQIGASQWRMLTTQETGMYPSRQNLTYHNSIY